MCLRYCSEGEKKTFLTLALVTFGLDNYSLLPRRPVYFRICSSVTNLYSLDTSSHLLPLVVTTKNESKLCQMSSREANSLLRTNYYVEPYEIAIL